MNCNENWTNFDYMQCAKMDANHRKTVEDLLHMTNACDFQMCSFGKHQGCARDVKARDRDAYVPRRDRDETLKFPDETETRRL